MKPGILLLGGLIALVAVAAPAAAQDAIVQGQVIAAADGSALPGVTVMLRSSAGEVREAATDAEGRFVFSQIPPQPDGGVNPTSTGDMR
jgi:hypothetical protein